MFNKLSPEEITSWTEKINSMSQYNMCRAWRFDVDTEFSLMVFDAESPLYPVFDKRFKELGGFTPEISKNLGWKK